MPKISLPLALVFLSLFIFFSPILFGKLPFPGDALVGLYHPYRDFYADKYPSGIPYKNFLLTDPVLQQIPWKYLVINELKKGRIPWWNPYTHAGMPLLANFQAGVFYPLNFIFWLFDFPLAWTIYIVVQPFLGALFLYIFLRYHKFQSLSAALTGLAWVLGGFMMVWLEWGNLGHTLIWLPLSLLIIDKYTETKKFKFILLNAIILSASLFAGHLQLAFYVILANLAYALYRRVNLLFAISYLLFAVVVLPQLLPTLQLIKLSARDIDQTQILTRSDWFLPWQHLGQFIAPDFFGNPATLNYTGVWNYAEFVGYIGIVPLILAISAILSKAGRQLGLAILVGLLFVLPTPLAKLPFILKLPLIAAAQPSRLIAVVSFGLAILAGIGMDQFLKRKFNWKFPLAFVGTSLTILWLNAASTVAQRNLILPSIIFIIFIMLVIIRVLLRSITFIPYLLFILTAAELLRFAIKFTPFSPKEYFYPQTQTIQFLQENLGDWRYMTTDRRLFPPNVGIIYGLKTIEGYDPLYLLSYARLITQMEGGTGIASFNRIIRPTNLDSPILNQLAVKYILSLSDIDKPQFKLVFQEGQTLVYENLSL